MWLTIRLFFTMNRLNSRMLYGRFISGLDIVKSRFNLYILNETISLLHNYIGQFFLFFSRGLLEHLLCFNLYCCFFCYVFLLSSLLESSIELSYVIFFQSFSWLSLCDLMSNCNLLLQEDRSSSVTIGVADEHIGLVVGRGGRNLMEISQVNMSVVVLNLLFLY